MLRRVLGVCALVVGVVALAMALFFLLTVVYHVYVDREGLPDIGPFARFEFPTVARVTAVNGNALVELRLLVPSGTAMRSVHFRTALAPDEAYRVCYGARI